MTPDEGNYPHTNSVPASPKPNRCGQDRAFCKDRLQWCRSSNRRLRSRMERLCKNACGFCRNSESESALAEALSPEEYDEKFTATSHINYGLLMGGILLIGGFLASARMHYKSLKNDSKAYSRLLYEED